MLLEDRIEYYKEEFLDCGLPAGIGYQDFFDLPMIDLISKGLGDSLDNETWNALFRIYANDQQTMDKLVEIFCKNRGNIDKKDFNALMENPIICENFIKSFKTYMRENDFAKIRPLSLIFNSDTLLDRIVNNDEIDINKLGNAFKMIYFDKESVLKLISDKRFLNIILNYDAKSFFSLVQRSGWDSVFKELIELKMGSLSYKERIVVIRDNFDITTGQPELLQEFYFTYEERINHDIKRDSIVKLRLDSSIDDKEAVRALIGTEKGQEILLKEVLEPQFSDIVNMFNLDEFIYQRRKEALFEELSNYSQYDIETVKNLLCVYCFEDNYVNISLRLKTLIEYASENDEALLMLKDDMRSILQLYTYLQNGDLETNPLELLNNINLTGLVSEAHSLFSKDVNRSTDITDILDSSSYKEIDGVKVIDVDIPLDRSYFLVHSISRGDVGDNPLENYIDKAGRHGKICTSILDNEHCNTFLDGIILGYCNMDCPIYSAVPFDGQSNQRNHQPGIPQYRSILSSVDSFMRRTTDKYNEVTYLTNGEVIMPSYLLVVDKEPNELQLKVAKDFNVPIFIYHTKEREYKSEIGKNLREDFVYDQKALEYIPNENVKTTKKTN